MFEVKFEREFEGEFEEEFELQKLISERRNSKTSTVPLTLTFCFYGLYAPNLFNV